MGGGRQHRWTRNRREFAGSRAVEEPRHARTLIARKLGDPVAGCVARRSPYREPLRGYDDDERTREVGQTHGTQEVAEQSRGGSLCGGGGGGKGAGPKGASKKKKNPGTEPDLG